jgi:CRISPR-associated protein Csb2
MTISEYRTQPAVRPGQSLVEAIRFAVASPAALPATRGILLADEVHRAVVRALDGGRAEVIGHAGATSNHTHAHWVPVPGGATIASFLLWAPVGLTTTEVANILKALSSAMGSRRQPPAMPGRDRLPRLRLHLQSAGELAAVAPELLGPARVWHSLTPYLPVRHRKPAVSMPEHLTQDVRYELAYRARPPATVQRLGPADELVDRWAAPYRRYRSKERSDQRRPGYGLRLEFEEPQSGPLLLGHLRHFGFGCFAPAGDDR